MKVIAGERPFVLTFARSRFRFAVTSVEAQRMLDGGDILVATPDRVVIKGQGATDATLRPATLGGGPAFEVRS